MADSEKNGWDATARQMILLSLANPMTGGWLLSAWRRRRSLKSKFGDNKGVRVGFIFGYMHGFFGQSYNDNERVGSRQAYVDGYNRGYHSGVLDARKQFKNVASAVDPGFISLLLKAMA